MYFSPSASSGFPENGIATRPGGHDEGTHPQRRTDRPGGAERTLQPAGVEREDGPAETPRREPIVRASEASGGGGRRRRSRAQRHPVRRTGPSPPRLEPGPEADPARSHPQATKILRSQIEAARAQKLAERCAVAVEPRRPAGPDQETVRIEKPIRLRIHRACHVCTTAFGSNKTCAQCQHVRCKACQRFPSKKAEKGKGERETEPGAQPLVMKKPKQRVRRHCHECQTLFPGRSKICPSCDHVRCVECPRDPNTTPTATRATPPPPTRPGPSNTDATDALKSSLRSRPSPAPTRPPRSSASAASTCGAPTVRARLRGVEPVPDPEVLKSVRAKLAALSVGVANP
ncbi:hypothetical protein BUE80_DR011479 [Diplocarpon rosae]|nr:hypothetical protein BUE80_DR011479 [Diplocarpon rosae]